MAIRRIFASLLVFLFVVVALPVFLVFGLSRTFLDPNFYAQEQVVSPLYQLLVNAVSTNIYSKDPLIQKYFQPSDIHGIVSQTLSQDTFQASMQNFSNDFAKLQSSPDQPMTFDLKPYRASLQNLALQLAVHIFESLPQCKTDELPQFTQDGIATCVPAGTNFQVAAGPLSQEFENSVLNALPDTVDLSLARNQNGSIFTFIMSSAPYFKFYGIALLMVLIILMAFVLYRPFTLILQFEGLGFLLSGFLGFILSISMNQIPDWLIQIYASQSSNMVKTLGGESVLAQYFQQIFSLFTLEVQKISFMFLGLGILLLGMYFFFLHRDARKETSKN